MRDALVQPATAEQVTAFAAAKGKSEAEARKILDELRRRQIETRAADPFSYGYEPPIWFVVKALIRNPVWSDLERKQIAKWGNGHGMSLTAERFGEMMRKRLGFAYPVTKVLVMGSNRSGKTDFSAKLCMQTCRLGGKFVGSGAQTLKTQKQNQMARVWHYMPLDWKKQNIATRKATDVVENISYTPKNGFANSKITFRNGSIMSFISYEQSIASQEGVEYDLVHLDEEYGIEHYNLFTTRITSRAGMFLGTFTPLHGYTPQVAKFLEGAQTVRWHIAYLRPKDGGEKLPWRELNLTKEEYEKLTAWRREGMQGDCEVRESVPENCFEWLLDAGDGRDTADVPEGRAFDATPRVAICQGGQAAAVWFYGSDNPYGLPSELILTKMADENAEQRILESVYGVARDMKGMLLKTFSRDRNVVDDEEVPEELVRCMVVDPAPERNWCMAWGGLDPRTGVLYVYREWPGNYEVPGQGVPGPWVVPSDKNGGMNDGARGDGQNSFGFGYNQIKFEIARLEGWADFEEWWNGAVAGAAQYGRQIGRSAAGDRDGRQIGRSAAGDRDGRQIGRSAAGGGDGRQIADRAADCGSGGRMVGGRHFGVARMPEDMEMVEEWKEGGGEEMVFRLLDSRAASQSKISRGTNRLLIEDLEGLMGGWTVADGQRCEVGYNVIIDKFAAGKIRIAKSCTNMIDCIETLTGKDGQKGAAKDFVDLLRYMVMSDIWNFGAEMASRAGGGSAGEASPLPVRSRAGRKPRRVWW